MREFFLPEDQTRLLLDHMEEEYEVFLFVPSEIIRYALLDREQRQRLVLGDAPWARQPRSRFPAKSFLLPTREHLAEYGPAAGHGDDRNQRRPPALVNLRACDVRAMNILDRIFLEGEWSDPLYQQRRESALIVSIDCATITEYCFCHTVGLTPAVERGSDMNLSPVSGGYVVRTEGGPGENLLTGLGAACGAVDESHRQQMRACLDATRAALEQSNARFDGASDYREILQRDLPSERWEELSATCVECGACTHICPTCYCFFMTDRQRPGGSGEVFEKRRNWDSCLLADYARMAGGAAKPNPRPRMRSRYENRFRHKYEYHHQTYGEYGCTGCGRCAESCMGVTDPREVMRVLSQ